MAETPEMLHTMLEYVHWRNEQQRNANRRGRKMMNPLL